MTEQTAIVKKISMIGQDITILHLQTEDNFAYKAGQYIFLSFDGILPARPYSIASAPGEHGNGMLEIHIKHGGGANSRYVMEELKEGARVFYTGPEGRSYYDGTGKEPILALAGGLGITPFKAIAAQAAHSGHAADFHLYWGAADRSGHYLEDYFTALQDRHDFFHYTPLTGADSWEKVLQDIGDLAAYRIYISGPPGMISHILPLLEEHGADRHKISYDHHPEASPEKQSAEKRRRNRPSGEIRE